MNKTKNVMGSGISADPVLQAEAQIRLGIRRLGNKYVFHARILERFVLQHRPDIATMGVSVRGEHVMLAYNAGFVLSLSLDQLLGVLLHEVGHVLFKHILLDPNDFANPAALTIAAELVVNEFVSEPLPKGVITLAMFPKFPPMESTMERYRRLEKIIRRKSKHAILFPIGAKPKSRGTGSGSISGVVDDHSLWAEACQDKRSAEATVDNLIQSVAHEVGAGNLPESVKGLLGGLLPGSQPGQDSEGLDPKAGAMDWTRLLRRYVGQAVEVRADYRRPPRRLSHLVGIIPGKRRISQRPRVMAVIDSSGSMTNEMLARISGELSLMARHYIVTVVECDCEIQKVYEYRPIKEIAGRGGTSFEPPLERSFLAKYMPDLIIFFTDGFGEAPERQPVAPVIWCLTPGGRPPANWGRVIRMESADSELTLQQ